MRPSGWTDRSNGGVDPLLGVAPATAPTDPSEEHPMSPSRARHRRGVTRTAAAVATVAGALALPLAAGTAVAAPAPSPLVVVLSAKQVADIKRVCPTAKAPAGPTSTELDVLRTDDGLSRDVVLAACAQLFPVTPTTTPPRAATPITVTLPPAAPAPAPAPAPAGGSAGAPAPAPTAPAAATSGSGSGSGSSAGVSSDGGTASTPIGGGAADASAPGADPAAPVDPAAPAAAPAMPALPADPAPADPSTAPVVGLRGTVSDPTTTAAAENAAGGAGGFFVPLVVAVLAAAAALGLALRAGLQRGFALPRGLADRMPFLGGGAAPLEVDDAPGGHAVEVPDFVDRWVSAGMADEPTGPIPRIDA